MRQLLPYAFARDHRLLLEDDGQQLTLWTCAESDRSALSEVLRVHGAQQPQWQGLSGAALGQRIQQAYAHAPNGSEGGAAAVVSEVESAARAKGFLEMGARLVTVMSDTAFLRGAAQSALTVLGR